MLQYKIILKRSVNVVSTIFYVLKVMYTSYKYSKIEKNKVFNQIFYHFIIYAFIKDQ